MPADRSAAPIAHYVAPFDVEEPIVHAEDVTAEGEVRSAWRDAWHALRRRPLFWLSSTLIAFIVFVALFPGALTRVPPDLQCELGKSLAGPEPGHPFGFDRQGCDVFSRVVHGARASLTVGLLTMVLVTVVGSVLGALAGYFGGWLDEVISRLGDIFYAIPTVLGAIVLMTVVPERNVFVVSIAMAIFAWPQVTRIARGSVLAASKSDYVMASSALGLSRFRILVQHVFPNALPPIIVIAAVSLGTYIVAEATLSFLGIGLPPSTMSWGNDIGQARTVILASPAVMPYPAGALSITVLAFLLLGDVVRGALDPEERARR